MMNTPSEKKIFLNYLSNDTLFYTLNYLTIKEISEFSTTCKLIKSMSENVLLRKAAELFIKNILFASSICPSRALQDDIPLIHNFNPYYGTETHYLARQDWLKRQQAILFAINSLCSDNQVLFLKTNTFIDEISTCGSLLFHTDELASLHPAQKAYLQNHFHIIAKVPELYLSPIKQKFIETLHAHSLTTQQIKLNLLDNVNSENYRFVTADCEEMIGSLEENTRFFKKYPNIILILFINSGIKKLLLNSSCLPIMLRHLILEGDSVTSIKENFLNNFHHLATLQLTGLTSLKRISKKFLFYCPNILFVDFSNLKKLASIDAFFMQFCAGIQYILLHGVESLQSIRDAFMCNCPQLRLFYMDNFKDLKNIGSNCFFDSPQISPDVLVSTYKQSE